MSDLPKTYKNSAGAVIVVNGPVSGRLHNGFLGDFLIGFHVDEVFGNTDLTIEPAAIERFGYVEQEKP